MSLKSWGIVLLVGLLLAVVAMPASDSREDTSAGTADFGAKEQEEERFETELEARLTGILETVQGVGKVQVLIHTAGEKSSDAFYSSGEQKVEGVLIVAEGADNSVTVQNIQQAVMSLFQLEAHKIKIMKMK